MKHFLRTSCWLSATAVAVMVLTASGQQPGAARPDRSKGEVVERPVAAVVKESSTARPTPPTATPDPTKRVRIEGPATAVVRNSGPTSPADSNPPIRPGKVQWHNTFAEATAAAKKSGKPVLLLHMMGKLDLQFC